AQDRNRRRGRSPEARQVSVGRQPNQDVGESHRSDPFAAARRAHRRSARRARLRQGNHRGAARRKGDLKGNTESGSGRRAPRAVALDIEGKIMANNKTEVRRILDKVKAEGRTSLTAPEGKLVCDAYGIPVPKEGVAKSAAEAAKIATDMGFPVVMKIVSPDILHKTEAGGVMVGVKTAADVEKNYAAILANAKK